MSLTNIQVLSNYITLGQFLKEINVISTGGQAKYFLANYDITVNSIIERRRGRKLYHGDRIQIPDVGEYQIL